MNRLCAWIFSVPLVLGGSAFAAVIQGTVHDTSGQPRPGVSVEVTAASQRPVLSVTDQKGHYSAAVPEGRYQVTFKLINFAGARRNVTSREDAPATIDVRAHCSL